MNGQPANLTDGRMGFFPLDAKALTNKLLDWADRDGISISPMKLQKLLFFCHADYLLQFNKPLLRQEFEAWDYGPVIPSIYAEFKKAGAQRIAIRAMSFDPVSAKKITASCDLPDDEAHRIYTLYSFYRHVSAEELSDISHSRGGPWRHARAMFANGLNMDRRISEAMIKRFHRIPHM